MVHLGVGSFSEVCFHTDRDNKLKQLSINERNSSSQKGFCTQSYEKQQQGWQIPEQFTETANYKIPKGYIIVAVKILNHADLLSVDSVPICNFVIMKEHVKPAKTQETVVSKLDKLRMLQLAVQEKMKVL